METTDRSPQPGGPNSIEEGRVEPTTRTTGWSDHADFSGRDDYSELLQDVWDEEAAREQSAGAFGRIDRFHILKELGRGGGGVVLLAHDPVLGRMVALKVPRPEALGGPKACERFLREAQAASKLDHPNIVPVYESGVAAILLAYIVSAYVEGIDLATWLAGRREPLPPRLIARLMAILARAVQHAHDRKILHRDIKPSNVLLQGARFDDPTPAPPRDSEPIALVPRLCDFGLAMRIDPEMEVSHARGPVGSPPYMAPEQVEGRVGELGPATDVYGLGAILYELLTGRPPFRGATSFDTWRMVVRSDLVSPCALHEDLPCDLVTICLKCLEKSPSRRYATAAALADDLDRYLEGLPVAPRPGSTAKRVIRWARRKPRHTAGRTVFGPK